MPSQISVVVQGIASEVDTIFMGDGPKSWGEPYKSAIFDLFRDNQTISGDRIRQDLHDEHNWPLSTDARASDKREMFEDICNAWDEWRYAIENI